MANFKAIYNFMDEIIYKQFKLLINFIIVVPPNGLVIYCGTIVTEEGKEKKVNIDFEPFKPINTSLYLCDNKVKLIKNMFYQTIKYILLIIYVI